jgi:hypothetical protein
LELAAAVTDMDELMQAVFDGYALALLCWFFLLGVAAIFRYVRVMLG